MLSNENCSRTISNIGRCDGNAMRQPLGIYHNMPLDAWYFLAAIIFFLLCGIRVFYTLCINDDEACFLCPSIVDTNFANDFFLVPPPGYSASHSALHSISENTHVHSAISDNLMATSAIGIRFSRHTALRSMHHTNQCFAASSSSVLPPTAELFCYIVPSWYRLGMFFAYLTSLSP